MSEKTFSLAEVAKHNSEGDIWIVVDRVVYDLTKFLKLHPGGKQVLLQHAGKDVSNIFFVYHHASVLKKYGPRLRIGVLEGPPPKKVEIPGTFGEMVPYGDPIWYQRFNTPYYKETHRQWRKIVREFTDKRVIETMDGWRDADEPPKDILQEMGKLGLLAIMNCRPWPSQYLDAGVPMPENPDYFHELIFYDEIARCGSSSVVAALTNGPAIALPVILKFGSEELKRRVAPDVLMGRKTIALAVSEPQAGSDVAGMVCTAQRQGDYYIVNGNKKWITNGTYADFFVTAVVTGKPGHQGISFLLIDKDTPGFSTRKLQIRDSNISGTAYLDFDNCKVPVSNLIGQENQGFKLVMYNFNHERLYVSAVCCRLARVCLEESIKYASKRTTFGKPLSDHQSIRMKIASMTRQVESLQNWLDFVTYQLTTMSHEEANIKVGDVLSLVKAQASKVYELCSRETTMIFGGNALYMTGVGRKIEPSVVQVKGYQIPAGAEDVMDDFAARAAFKKAQLLAKL